MKKQFLRLALFLLALSLPVSGSRNNQALVPMAAPVQEETTQEAEAMEEIYQAVPGRLFPISANAWVGDVMPMGDGDELKLYYLYDTDHNGPLYHPIHLFTTTNFYEYRDEGLAVKCGPDLDAPDSAIGTGSVLKAREGLYHCFYTGHNDTAPDKGRDKECVMHAVSEDGLSWKKSP